MMRESASLLGQIVTEFVIQNDNRFYLKDKQPLFLRTRDEEWGGGKRETQYFQKNGLGVLMRGLD